MKRKVRKEHIESWIYQNGRNAMAKLALQSEVSLGTWAKVRGGYVPTKEVTRQKICRALGVSEDDLFPVLLDRKERAS